MPLAKYPDQRPGGRRRRSAWRPGPFWLHRYVGRPCRGIGGRGRAGAGGLGYGERFLGIPGLERVFGRHPQGSGLPSPGKILTGCQISPSQTGTIVLQWDSAKLKVNGQAKTLKNIDVQVTVAKFGHSYSMNLNTYGETPASITFQSNMPFGWSSVSGTLTTTKSGSGGSVSASMSAGKAHSGTVSVKGSWAGCANLG